MKMQNKFSQEAVSFVYGEKAKWLEIQLMNTVDQLIKSEAQIEKYKNQLDEANLKIDELVKESIGKNGS